MTGAGSAQVAYAVESSYGTLPGTPTWKQPFTDIEVGSVQLSNSMTRGRQPDDPRPKESREGPVEGQISLSGTMTDTNFHELIFPESSNTSLATSGSLAPTATWYFDSSLLSGTADRFPAGAAVDSVAWNYQEGQDVTVDLTITFRAGEKNITAPSSISQPSVSNSVPWHGTSFSVNSTSVSKLQSLTLEIANMARHRAQQSREAADAVVGAYEPSLSFNAIPSDETNLEYQYGSAGATSTEDTIAKQSATLTFSNSGGTVATYNLSNLQSNDYDWQNLVTADTDLVEVPSHHISDVAVA